MAAPAEWPITRSGIWPKVCISVCTARAVEQPQDRIAFGFTLLCQTHFLRQPSRAWLRLWGGIQQQRRQGRGAQGPRGCQCVQRGALPASRTIACDVGPPIGQQHDDRCFTEPAAGQRQRACGVHAGRQRRTAAAG